MEQFECMYFIVHHGMASKILRFARNHGISGGTIFFGKGSGENFWMNFLELNYSEKEVLIMVAQREKAFKLMELLKEDLNLEKPGHGIVFSVPTFDFTGGSSKEDLGEEEEYSAMYQVITVIVKKGKAEEALEAAQEAGARGGTIINARGAGRLETSRFFLMDIETEKEILLLLTEKEKSSPIMEAINEKIEMEKTGHGVMFVQDVNKAYGLYDSQ